MPSVTGATDLIKGLVPITQAGIVGPMGPSRLAGVVSAWYQWDFTAGGLLAVAARRDGDRIAVIDDRGPISYRQLNADAHALAAALHERGLRERGRIGILARNHRGFLIAMGASARLGTDLVLLNTGASTTQLAEVLAEQRDRLAAGRFGVHPAADGHGPPGRGVRRRGACGASRKRRRGACGASRKRRRGLGALRGSARGRAAERRVALPPP